MDLDGMVVIVTGSAQGIGRAFGLALAAAGARVALCDINCPDSVVTEVRAVGGIAIGGKVDVTDATAIAAFVERTEKELGPIDALVNNAAIFGGLIPKPFTQLTTEEFQSIVTVNTSGVFECSKAVLSGMQARRRGKIVNIASTTVNSGTPFMLHYVASKGAVVAMTRAMARELGDYNISVNSISPGLTSSTNVRESQSLAALQGGVIQRRCFKREQEPEDLTGPLIFLLSDSSAFITGQSIVVDGGGTMQ